MPTITATADNTNARVRLDIDWSDNAAVTYARVRRGAGAAATATDPEVRLHGETYDDGDDTYKLLSKGETVLYDTEAPLNTALHYRLETATAVSASVATAGPVTITATVPWLKSPLRPYLDRPLSLSVATGDPDCVAGQAIYYVGLGGEQFASASALSFAEGATRPVAFVRPRRDLTTTLTLVTRTREDRDALEELLAPGDPLLLQVPSEYDWDDAYVAVGDVSRDRLTRDQRKPWRLWSLPLVRVDRPEGVAFGVLGARWTDLCGTYATWGAVSAAGKTWLDVLQGEAA